MPNDVTFVYRFRATRDGSHFTLGHDSGRVTPREDPYPPEAQVVINEGAAVTCDPLVTPTFVPRGEGILGVRPTLDDVVEMMVNNNPFYAGAQWQAFEAEMPWRLEVTPGQTARVFARFRDLAGNESVGTMASILFDRARVWLPLVQDSYGREAGE